MLPLQETLYRIRVVDAEMRKFLSNQGKFCSRNGLFSAKNLTKIWRKLTILSIRG
jgi:hypothetical protein